MSSPGDKLSSQCPNGGGFTGSITHIYGTLEQSTVHTVHYRRVKPLLHCTCLASSQHINKTMQRHHASLAVLSLAAACSGLTATVTKTLPAPPPAPRLTAADEALLRRSGRVERVERDGRVGAAWAVVDSAMAADDAWTVIREVENYDRTIRGVKAAALKPATAPDVVRAGFQLTKLRLPANLAFEVSGPRELTVARDADARNVAIERLAGAWRVEEREGGGCRVSLAARVEACRVVPARVVDYVAERALRRATKWL